MPHIRTHSNRLLEVKAKGLHEIERVKTPLAPTRVPSQDELDLLFSLPQETICK